MGVGNLVSLGCQILLFFCLLLVPVFSGRVWKNRIGGGGALRRFFLVSEEERFQDALFWNKLLRVRA